MTLYNLITTYCLEFYFGIYYASKFVCSYRRSTIFEKSLTSILKFELSSTQIFEFESRTVKDWRSCGIKNFKLYMVFVIIKNNEILYCLKQIKFRTLLLQSNMNCLRIIFHIRFDKKSNPLVSNLA